MANELKVGDVVRLKSSGPWMTIAKIKLGTSNDVAKGVTTCQWFSGDVPHSGDFYVYTLRRIKPNTKVAEEE